MKKISIINQQILRILLNIIFLGQLIERLDSKLSLMFHNDI